MAAFHGFKNQVGDHRLAVRVQVRVVRVIDAVSLSLLGLQSGEGIDNFDKAQALFFEKIFDACNKRVWG